MSRRIVSQGAVLASLAVVAGCTAEASSPAADLDNEIVVTDWGSTEIRLDAPAQRVVCLDGTCIDALTELDLPPVASVQIDQVRHEFFFGDDVDTVALGGTFFEPDLEGIVAAEPDLVIGSLNVHGSLREALGDIPFFGVSLGSDEDAVDNLQRIAELTGRGQQADAAIERYRQVLADYGPRDREVEILSMYGGATADIGIDALDSAIGRLLANYTAYPWPDAGEGDSGFLEIGLEEILAVDPEHIFVLDFAFDPSARPLVDDLATQPIWSNLRAVQAGQVYVVDNSWWGTTAGTRGQQLYLDVVLPTVYPEEFSAPLGIAAE